MFDKVRNEYVPTVTGLGMHVEVRDPEIKIVMSRVRAAAARELTQPTLYSHLL